MQALIDDLKRQENLARRTGAFSMSPSFKGKWASQKVSDYSSPYTELSKEQPISAYSAKVVDG